MTVTKVIRNKTHPDSADENERLIRAVFAELAEQQPPGLRYAAFRLDDGVSFLHVAVDRRCDEPAVGVGGVRQVPSRNPGPVRRGARCGGRGNRRLLPVHAQMTRA